MTDLNKSAVFTIAALMILILGVIGFESLIPISVVCTSPADCSSVGPFGTIILSFSRPVDVDKIESLWQTTPELPGKWEVVDDRNLRWTATKPLPSEQEYLLELHTGTAGKSGEQLADDSRWRIILRQPKILGMGMTEKNKFELYVMDVGGRQQPIQLTDTNGGFYDYSVSPNGDMIAYSVINEEQGADLWLMNRDGSDQRILLKCGTDVCITPEWSPVTTEIAYSRENSGVAVNSPHGAPRVWIVDYRTGLTSSLVSDPQEIGYGAKWSPDGAWLSYWDGVDGGVKMINRNTGKNYLVPSSSGESGCWLADSEHLVFTNTLIGLGEYHNVLLMTKRGDDFVETIMGENIEGGGTNIINPVCNPIQNSVTVSIQPNVNVPGRILVILDPENGQKTTVIDNLAMTPGAVSWSPDGNNLLFQIFELASSKTDTQIWMWDGRESRMVSSSGFRFPQWLP